MRIPILINTLLILMIKKYSKIVSGKGLRLIGYNHDKVEENAKINYYYILKETQIKPHEFREVYIIDHSGKC